MLNFIKENFFSKHNYITVNNPPQKMEAPVGALPVRLALQVASLDKGGLEQVVYNLLRRLNTQKFIVTLFICGEETGYLGGLLQLDGFDVVTLGWNKARLKAVLLERKIGLANLHYSVWGIEEYENSRIPVVYTVHSSYTWLSRREVNEHKRAFRKVAAFIAVSSMVKSYFCHRFEVPITAVQVIPNGIDASEFETTDAISRAAYGFNPDDFIFINVSSFVPVKSQGLMIAALRPLLTAKPNARLLLVGNVMDPEYHQFVLNRIREEQLEQYVRIVDYVPRTELGKLLAIADCFLLPSLQEGWSNAIMEAMYFNLPLILSDTGSARDLISNSDIGIIIPNPYRNLEKLDCDSINRIAYDKRPGNLEYLLRAMADMMENAPVWRGKCEYSKERVINCLSVDRMADAYSRFFSQVIALLR